MNPLRPRPVRHVLALAFAHGAVALALMLSGCNGEPDDPNARTTEQTVDPQSTMSLSGTVAAGAPLVGTLEVKDARGARKRVQVAADGGYRVGLKGLTFPLLLRATGHVGGHQGTLVSAATASDADGTVNVTPFTDLIVAKLARGAADAFFEHPDHARLTNAFLDEARAMVTQIVAPVMDELRVDRQLDLRRSRFAADHTHLDAMLDVVRVRVDAARNRALIQDVVNGTATEIDLGNLDERAALPSPPRGSYASAVADLQAVDEVLQRFNRLFADNVPSAGNSELRALFADDFRHAGVELSTFLSGAQLLVPGNVGLRLFNPVILSRAADGHALRVSVQVMDTRGHVIAHDQVDADELLMTKGSDGAWRIAGDRRMGDVALSAVNALQMETLSATVPATIVNSTQALELWVPSAAASVRHVQITGPGLPPVTTYGGMGAFAGVLLSRSGAGQPFMITSPSGQSTGSAWLPACPQSGGSPCAEMGRIPAWASYTVRFMDAGLQPLGEDTPLSLPAPPLSADEAGAQASARFALPSSLYPASFTQLRDGVALRLGWSEPSAWDHTVASAALSDGTQNLVRPASDGGASQVLGAWTGAAPSAAPWVWTRVQGPFDRAFIAAVPYPRSTGTTP